MLIMPSDAYWRSDLLGEYTRVFYFDLIRRKLRDPLDGIDACMGLQLLLQCNIL